MANLFLRSQLIGAGSLATVVALNVFDTIDRDRLHDAASALLRTLEPGGRAVILADLLFHENPFLKKYAIEVFRT